MSALRPLTLDDAPGLAAIAVERRWRPHLEAWRIALSLGKGFAVELGEGLAAAAVLLPHGEGAAVLSVLTSPRYTGQGLGRRVAEAALALAGRAAVEMHAPPGGIAFAARLGFHPVGSSTRYVGARSPCHVPTAPRACAR